MEAVAPRASVTVAVKLSVPDAVGVPVIAILGVPDPDKLTPGTAPETFEMVIVWAPVPPLAIIVWFTAIPTVPADSDDGDRLGSGLIVPLVVCVAVCGVGVPLSVTLI